MADRPVDLSELTAGEKAQLAWLTARMCKRSLAGPNVSLAALQRKFDRVLATAREREKQSKNSKS